LNKIRRYFLKWKRLPIIDSPIHNKQSLFIINYYINGFDGELIEGCACLDNAGNYFSSQLKYSIFYYK